MHRRKGYPIKQSYLLVARGEYIFFFKNGSLGRSLRRNYKYDVSVILIVWPVCRIHSINRRYLLHVRFYASQQKRLFPDLSVKRVWSSSSQQTCKLL